MITPDHSRSSPGALRIGSCVTAILGFAGVVYALAGHSGPHTVAMAAICAAATLDGLLIWRLAPVRRLRAAGRLDDAVMAWNLLHVVPITAVAALDGGLASPFVAMYFVTIVFCGLTSDRRRLAPVIFWDAAGVIVLAFFGGPAALLLIYVPCIIGLGLIAATIAQELHDHIHAVETAQQETIEKLARAVEYRDESTGGHIDRMATYARILAERLGLPDAHCDLIHRAGPLHDVGKIGMPDSILLKPGKLTLGERLVMERHAQAGHDLLRGSRSAVLRLGAEIALTHHERWDGEGYPNRLCGEEIPLPARIVAVADVFDAVTTDRVYRDAMPLDVAVGLIGRGRGTQFDPAVVDAFMAALDEISEVGARRDPGTQAAELASREDRPVGAEGEPGREAGLDRPVLA